jgi:hypothetical protein
VLRTFDGAAAAHNQQARRASPPLSLFVAVTADDPEMVRPSAGRHRFETYRCKPTLQQLAKRRRPARHPQAEPESSIAFTHQG